MNRMEEIEKKLGIQVGEDCGIFAPPTKSQNGLNILIHHFLGEGWYTFNPISTEQVNTEAIEEILEKYPSGKFRRIHKK